MHLIINQSSVSCANAPAEQGLFRHPLGGAGPIGASDDLMRLLFVVLVFRFWRAYKGGDLERGWRFP